MKDEVVKMQLGYSIEMYYFRVNSIEIEKIE